MVKVDEDLCIGCGTCEHICPEVFEMKDSIAKIKEQKDDDCVKEAIEACPVDAIK
ncbi:MAG: ferredoxin [Candidatus Pacearchaeota archaeon]|jgi:ferredoxin